MVQAAVVGPAVELGRVFELLATAAIDGQERTVQIGERAHVAPEFLELGDRVDILLPVAPAALDVLDRDISRHAGGHRADRAVDFERISCFKCLAGQPEGFEQAVDLDPGREGIVIPELELGVFAGLCQSLEQADAGRRPWPVRRRGRRSAAE